VPFPIDQVNERHLPPDFEGEVFVCDIDRTYLYTRFSSLRGISRIPFEFAVDKQDIEGMAALLREVRRGPARVSRITPLYFISASPAQLRPVIQRKMLLDGLEFDGTTFKDWVGVAASLRPRRFREQLGFKLTALLALVADLPAGVRLTLMGDDLETDALAFALLADALAGRVRGAPLRRILTCHGVARDDARFVARAAEAQGARGPRVSRALIRMERHHDPEAFLDYWPHLAVCRGALQMAATLAQAGSLSIRGTLKVARDLVGRGQRPEQVRTRLEESARRALLGSEEAEVLRGLLEQEGLIPAGRGPLPPPDRLWTDRASAGKGQPWTPGREHPGAPE